ncbi:carboxypeptidase-like regulatory domain-containing protein [Ravibacter arvi]|uniref:Carboxypeptidase-like regulatory domain-containing protein n=1 Tax=Ravibacter arvi TaxID=2051041 RepID=A0ABP8LUZ0_9BACT
MTFSLQSLYKIVVGVLLLVHSFQAAGQSKKDLVSGDFLNLGFSQFIEDLERQTGYTFYYEPDDFDSLQVTMQVKNQPLHTVLAALFQDSAFRFAIDPANRVFITRTAAVITFLPADRSVQSPDSVVAYAPPENEETTRLISGAESKVHEIGTKTYRKSAGNAVITGYIRNIRNGEALIGAAVFIEKPSIGAIADAMGYYSITLPKGRHTLKIKSFGMRETYRTIELYGNGTLDIEMKESVIALREVAVIAGADVNVTSSQMGQVKLSMKTIRQIPSALGEADLLRTVMTVPGVKSVGESSVGLNIRGGSADQNLITFNDVPVYNPSHLFGFFTSFNPDILKDVELYKSAIPARYGGRLSSVLEINSRDGNRKRLVGAGGIGLLTGKLSIEGPIVKDKSSFLISGRSTYSDWLLKKLENQGFRNGSASFYDVNVHLSHEVDQKNSVYLSGYLSGDRFRLLGDTLYTYQNKLISFKWKRMLSKRLFGSISLSHNQYQYDMKSTRVQENAFGIDFGIKQYNAKIDFEYELSTRQKLHFGGSSIRYELQSGSMSPIGPNSLVRENRLEPEQAQESAVYLESHSEISDRLLLSVGLRGSMFNYLGPKSVSRYVEGFPLEKRYLKETVRYNKGENIQTYLQPEYRASLRYVLTGGTSLKASFTTTRQYLHLLTNTMTVSPTDVWKLSDVHLKPQKGSQFSLGWYRNLLNNKIELSAEAYYKDIRNFLDFKSGDSLILNHNIETATVVTNGKAYGIELLAKKMSGKVNGWVAYTYSRTLLRAVDRASADAPNNGNYYPANYDKPHDVTIAANYKLTHRLNFSLNFTYSTGRPYTPPIGKYLVEGAWRTFYAERNQYRIPDYYRTDVSINIEGNHKVRKLAHSSWTLAVYNLLGRRNPSSVYFQTNRGNVQGYQLSIFGKPVPSITYNFRF